MKSVPDPLAEENLLKQSGRGLLLIQAFVDEFEMRRRQPSGTEVRRRIADRGEWEALVPAPVARFIREQGLYGCGSGAGV